MLCVGLAVGETDAQAARASVESGATSAPVTVVSPVNALSPEEEETGWMLLFNGKDLSGWRTSGGTPAVSDWIVRDSSISYLGRGSATLLSTQSFSDFELTMEWKVGRGDDAGLFLRVWDESRPAGEVAPEFQIIDNRGSTLAMEPKRSAGACSHLYAPRHDASLPQGSYNRLRVVVVGNQVEHWLNGSKVLEYSIGGADWLSRLSRSPLKEHADLGSSPRGYIGLQQADGTVRFRNIKVRPLGEAASIAYRKPVRARKARAGLPTLFSTPQSGRRDVNGRLAYLDAGNP
jgi:hypothetical protein